MPNNRKASNSAGWTGTAAEVTPVGQDSRDYRFEVGDHDAQAMARGIRGAGAPPEATTPGN